MTVDFISKPTDSGRFFVTLLYEHLEGTKLAASSRRAFKGSQPAWAGFGLGNEVS